MQQFLSRFRLQTKLLASFAVLLCILFLASSMIRLRLVDVHDEVNSLVNDRHPIELLATKLDARLDDSIASLGLFVSVRSQDYADNFHRELADVFHVADQLQRNPLVRDDPKSARLLQEVRQNIDTLAGYSEELIKLTASDESIFPGLAYANEHINPLSRDMLQILSQLLHADPQESTGDRRRLLLLKADLRYYWINVISGVRAYLAYRSDHVLQDSALYLEAARHTLQEIAALGESLSLEDEEALPKLRTGMDRFEYHWKQLQAIHTGENWRSDSNLMRTRIGPLFARIEEQLETFSDEQHAAMVALSGRLIDHSQQITRLTDGLLLIGALVSVVISWGISRIFIKPIKQISGAMEKIAGGDTDLTQRLDADGRDEVAQLARSFNTFADKAQQSAEEERALSTLLRLSLTPTDLNDYLNEALRQMIGTVTWLALQPKGGIFLSEAANGEQLKLAATHNFSPQLLDLCARVPRGKCLCGRAAASGEIVFADCVDQQHEIRFDGMSPHGHYAVPIKSGTASLGVLILYLPEHHVRSDTEIHFLNKIAEVLSMGIRLRQANADLMAAKHRAESVSDQLTGITANIPGIIYQCRSSVDGLCEYPFVSPGTANLLGTAEDDPFNDIQSLFHDVHPHDEEHLKQTLQDSSRRLTSVNVEYRAIQQDGGTRWILCNALPRRDADGSILWDGLLLDITDRKNLEIQLLQAQKLESVGQLAAGIAHEINTPTQYVQDNTHFLQEAFESYQTALSALRRLRERLPDTLPDAGLLDEVDRALEEEDIDFLSKDIPQAISQSLEGLRRIASIVSAMKEFTHPGTDVKQPVDINAVIGNIVTVSRNEWKYVAELETDLQDDLPSPPGHRDKLGQVILNLIVNAAHAIADEVSAGNIEKGRIRVSTTSADGAVEIRISDDGPGIAESIQQKIFDPFFTTKEVGKGTGQGLSIARSVVVDQHQGSLMLNSTAGAGATFIIRLPLQETQGGGAIAA